MKTFLEYSIEKLAKSAKIDISGLDPKELSKGFKTEKEHDGRQGKDTKIVNNDVDALKIAVAHLREKKNYYALLDKAGL